MLIFAQPLKVIIWIAALEENTLHSVLVLLLGFCHQGAPFCPFTSQGARPGLLSLKI
jgi:hypothetical protein